MSRPPLQPGRAVIPWLLWPVDGDMEQINCFAFYDLGNVLQHAYLMAYQPIPSWVYSAEKAYGILDAMLQGSGNFKFNESRGAVQELAAVLDEVIVLGRLRGQDDTPHPAASLSKEQVERMNLAMRIFNTALSLELGRAPIFFVTPKGVYDTQRLIADAASMYEGYLDRLPQAAIEDTNAAGRCLAFDLPTAAGFHIARATEAMIKRYMENHGCETLKESQRNWGNYTKALAEKRANKLIIHHIDQIRELHRNPITHPDVTLSRADAMSLQAMCQSVIQSMVADIERRKATPDPEIVRMLPTSATGWGAVNAPTPVVSLGWGTTDEGPFPESK